MDTLFETSSAAEPIDVLAQKVQRVALELIDSKRKRQQMQTELDTLRNETKHYQILLKENEKMRKDHALLQTRLERLNKKLERVMLNSLNLTGTTP